MYHHIRSESNSKYLFNIDTIPLAIVMATKLRHKINWFFQENCYSEYKGSQIEPVSPIPINLCTWDDRILPHLYFHWRAFQMLQVIIPLALRMARTSLSFGSSECYRVKDCQINLFISIYAVQPKGLVTGKKFWPLWSQTIKLRRSSCVSWN